LRNNQGEVNEPTPHLLRDITERTLAGLDLLVEDFATLRAATEEVEENVAGVLHENGAIEI